MKIPAWLKTFLLTATAAAFGSVVFAPLVAKAKAKLTRPTAAG